MTTAAEDQQRPSNVPSNWGHRPHLDGVRTLAVYLVVAFHAKVAHVSGGFVGVDLFFVLSGFVVTNVLLVEAATHGSIRMRRFYARRMRRLTPAAVATIIGTALLMVLVVPLAERLSLVSDARAALLYVANWHFLAGATDYFADNVQSSPFVHFWSLAIEEQFYFVYPLLFAGALWLQKRLRRVGLLPAVIGLLLAISLGLQIWAGNTQRATLAYYGTHMRLYQLLAGCLLAMVLGRIDRRLPAGPWSALAVVALVGLGYVASRGFEVSPSTRGLVATVFAVGLIASLELVPGGLANRVLSVPAIVYLGNISYGVYLWHWPIIQFLNRLLRIEGWRLAVLAGVLATGLAAASFRLIEDGIRRNKRLDPRPAAVVAAGLATAVLTAFVVVPPVLRSSAKPRLASASVEAVDPGGPAPGVVPGLPSAAASVPGGSTDAASPTATEPSAGQSNGSPSATAPALPAGFDAPVPDDIPYEDIRSHRQPVNECSAKDPGPCVLRLGKGKTVVAIGDSVAQQFIPNFMAMADKYDWTYVQNILSACSWQAGLKPRPDIAAGASKDCITRRADWYREVLPGLKPDVILLMQVSRDEAAFDDVLVAEDPALAGASLAEVNRVTMTRTMDTLLATGAKIVVVEPPPVAYRPGPTQCLSGATTVGKCAFTVKAPAPSEAVLDELAAAHPAISLVDIDRLPCPDLPICMPIVDGVAVWRDNGHFSHLFVEHVADKFEAALMASGAFG